jgi:hypothetical protein
MSEIKAHSFCLAPCQLKSPAKRGLYESVIGADFWILRTSFITMNVALSMCCMLALTSDLLALTSDLLASDNNSGHCLVGFVIEQLLVTTSILAAKSSSRSAFQLICGWSWVSPPPVYTCQQR